MTDVFLGEWNPNTVYNSVDANNGGDTDVVEYQGALWVANFYNVGLNPMAYSSPPGQTTNPNNSGGIGAPGSKDAGQPVGPGYPWSLDTAANAQIDYNVVVPSWAPPQAVVDGVLTTLPILKAGYTSSSSVALFWQPAEVLGVGDVSSYDVYAENDATGVTTLAGTTTSTGFTVSGLTGGATYTFSIDANDLTGTSGAQAQTGTSYIPPGYSVPDYTWNENPGFGANPTLTLTTPATEASTGKYFSPYLDMTLPTTDLQTISANSGLRDFTLAFMQTTTVSTSNLTPVLSNGAPTLSWGGLGAATTESTGTMIQEVKTVEAEGGAVTISIGGYDGLDPAVNAATNNYTAAQLQAEYQAVITTYGVSRLDFDIENASTVDNYAANHLRDEAIIGLENANPGLQVSFTLATTPQGLATLANNAADTPANDATASQDGFSNDYGVLQQAEADGVKLNTVNIMAMDYYTPGETQMAATGLNVMASNAISAAQGAEAELQALGLTSTKIGITPMIGQNDDPYEVFTLADAQAVEAFAASQPWVAGLGEWELPRDTYSSSASVGVSATDGASGVVQSAYQFASTFSPIETNFSVADDFTDDGISDILLRNTNGDVEVWNSNSSGGRTTDNLGVVPSAWAVQGVGDFNGDGKADILWRNTNGDVEVWNSNAGSETFTSQNLGVVSSAVTVQGVGDFNGDGKDGILWRNTNGDVVLWNANASSETFTSQNLGVVSSAWTIQGVGDFNDDGKDGILWRNTNGDVDVWNANSSGTFTPENVGVVSSAWTIQGVGDFNGDGKDDILLRNTNGDVEIWNSNSSGTFTSENLGVVSSAWSVAAIGDYNGAGQDDILWRSTNGALELWTPKASATSSSETFTSRSLGSVPSTWTITTGVGHSA